ncbi:hypothetical protein ABEB36_003598 [Hypothenemus hampei]|uniref:THAP-type domain-containing protein n=1 Tax=Hypothenemus hampei TaxID=57062 RepID=A0ABD1FCC6_HYPHA
MACIVKNCKNVQRFLPLESKITFHRFPKNTLRYHEWLLALGIDVDTPHNRTMLVCSQHFKEEDFKTVNKPRKFNPNATPKLKDFPHEIPMQVCTQKVQPQPSSAFRTSGFVVSDEKSPKKSKETEHRAPASKKLDLSGSSSSSKRRLKRIRIEHQYATTPMTLLKKYKHMTNTLKFQSAKLYKTQARLTTIKRKVSSLKEIVRDLQKKI